METNNITLPDIILPNSEWKPSLVHVYAKTNWANGHLNALEGAVKKWIKGHPYSVTEEDDPEKIWHAFIIKTNTASRDIPLIVGDYINCLRSALDQLAWNLVHLCPETIPKNERIAKQIVFPVCETDSAYASKRGLFHPDIGKVFDTFQPEDRTNAYRSHPLWQLDKLWNIDKHRMIAVNCCKFDVTMRGGINGRIENFEDRMMVLVPCVARLCYRPVYVEPRITPQVLFGEYMGDFEITLSDLRKIYEFVGGKVIPAFAGFFPKLPGP